MNKIMKTNAIFCFKDKVAFQEERHEKDSNRDKWMCSFLLISYFVSFFFSSFIGNIILYFKVLLKFSFFLCFWVSFKLFENGGKMNKPLKKKIPNKNSKYKFRKKKKRLSNCRLFLHSNTLDNKCWLSFFTQSFFLSSFTRLTKGVHQDSESFTVYAYYNYMYTR